MAEKVRKAFVVADNKEDVVSSVDDDKELTDLIYGFGGSISGMFGGTRDSLQRAYFVEGPSDLHKYKKLLEQVGRHSSVVCVYNGSISKKDIPKYDKIVQDGAHVWNLQYTKDKDEHASPEEMKELIESMHSKRDVVFTDYK